MGKLLDHQLKRYFSKNWFLIVAPIAATVLTFFSSVMNLSWYEVVLGFSVLGLMIFYMAAQITVIIEDYQLFYGKSALFYQSIPANASDKIFSRLLYYIINIIVYSLVYGLCFISLMMTEGINKGIDIFGIINQIFVELANLISAAGWKNVAFLVVLGIILVVYTVSKIIFSISVGSEKKLRKFGIAGPVLVYALTSIFEVCSLFLIDRIGIVNNIAIEINNNDVSVEGGSFVFLGLCLLQTIIFLSITYYEHQKRVSVS